MSYYDHATMIAYKLGPWATPEQKMRAERATPRRRYGRRIGLLLLAGLSWRRKQRECKGTPGAAPPCRC